MAKSTDSADSQATADPTVDPSTVPDNIKEAEKERKDAQETADPNDDFLAAAADEGREISVPHTVVEAEAPEPEKVKVSLNPEFKEPVLEEYTDDKGILRGKVKEYAAPEGDVKVYSATAAAQDVGEDGYVTLPATVPASVAADLAGSPAVVVE